jgi:hypothetical protein
MTSSVHAIELINLEMRYQTLVVLSVGLLYGHCENTGLDSERGGRRGTEGNPNTRAGVVLAFVLVFDFWGHSPCT